MGKRIDEIIGELAANSDNIVQAFWSYTPDQLETVIYDEGMEWRVLDVLAHFASIERSMQWLFTNVAKGGPGSPSDFDVDRYNQKQVANFRNASIEELVAEFGFARAELIRIVEGFEDDMLDNVGWHAYLGTQSLETMIRWAYKHTEHHLQEIDRALNI